MQCKALLSMTSPLYLLVILFIIRCYIFCSLNVYYAHFILLLVTRLFRVLVLEYDGHQLERYLNLDTSPLSL